MAGEVTVELGDLRGYADVVDDVARYLGRVSGYADTHPIDTNATAAGRAANRRVEIVVHSLVDEAALVADVAGTSTPPTSIDAIVDPIPEASHGQEEG